jgi:predicted DNA binding protein
VSVIVEVTIPTTDFPLGRARPRWRGRTLRTRADDSDQRPHRPFLFVENADIDALEARLADDDTIDTVTLVDDYDGEALFRLEWPAGTDGFIEAINDHEAAILEAIGTDEHWEFQLRFPDSADIGAFSADCEHAGVGLDLRRLYHPDEPPVESSGLTPTQRETLLTALETGYFAIPRRITGEELAAELGISDQAVSERLRRAQTAVFRAVARRGVIRTIAWTSIPHGFSIS